MRRDGPCSKIISLLKTNCINNNNNNIILGPATHLSSDQETVLVNWIHNMKKINYGVTQIELPDVVKGLLDQAEKNWHIIPADKKFANNKPSNNWVYRFLERHPEVSVVRMRKNLKIQQPNIAEPMVWKWFADLKFFLSENHNLDVRRFFSDEAADRIFKLDDSKFPLEGNDSILGVISQRRPKTRNPSPSIDNNKEQITLLACVSAAGTFQKPMVIYPGVRTPKYNFSGVNASDFDVSHSINGCMTVDIFFTWLSCLFYPSVKDKVQFPIVLFMDGRTSHINFAVTDFCHKHGIILYCFPAHGSNDLQPLDDCVFGPLETAWNKSVDQFKLLFQILPTGNQFFQVFDQAWKATTASSQRIVSGFRSTGLVPWDLEHVLRQVGDTFFY